MSDQFFLTNQFLIAMPGMMDPNFFRTVTYICEHNEQGAMGIVINQPVEMTVGQMLESIGIKNYRSQDMSHSVYRGGPVDADCGFVIHSPVGKWDSSIQVCDQLAVSTSSDIITALANGDGPDKFLVALGYAGWSPGQLEHEMAANAWLSGPADASVIFSPDNAAKWSQAASLLGVDIDQISEQVGHA